MTEFHQPRKRADAQVAPVHFLKYPLAYRFRGHNANHLGSHFSYLQCIDFAHTMHDNG